MLTIQPNVASTAKRTLTRIVELNLAPTPQVYEVFFRHYEGSMPELSQEFEIRLENADRLDESGVLALHHEFCHSHRELESEKASCIRVAEEVNALQQIVTSKQDFDRSTADHLKKAKEKLNSSDMQQLADAAAEIEAATFDAISHTEQIRNEFEQSQKRLESLEEELREARLAAMQDHLTGLGNRKYFETNADEIIQRFSEKRHCLDKCQFLILVDADKLKQVNDVYGHALGDRVIKLIGKILGNNEKFKATRLGGDEFAIFYSSDSTEECQEICETVRAQVKGLNLVDPTTGDQLDTIKLSIGAALLTESDNRQSWYERADKLLYEAKRLGGDRIVFDRLKG